MDGDFRFQGPSGAAEPRLADSWFHAPGSTDKAAAAAASARPSRSPLGSLQAGAPEQQQQEQPAKPSNIRTSWGPAPPGGYKRVAAPPAASSAAAGAPPAAAAAEPPASRRAASTPRQQRQQQARGPEQGEQQQQQLHEQQQAPLASPGVATRSMCKALGLALTPPLERARPQDFRWGNGEGPSPLLGCLFLAQKLQQRRQLHTNKLSSAFATHAYRARRPPPTAPTLNLALPPPNPPRADSTAPPCLAAPAPRSSRARPRTSARPQPRAGAACPA